MLHGRPSNCLKPSVALGKSSAFPQLKGCTSHFRPYYVTTLATTRMTCSGGGSKGTYCCCGAGTKSVRKYLDPQKKQGCYVVSKMAIYHIFGTKRNHEEPNI